MGQADVKRLVTTGKVPNMEDLSNVKGRAWDDIDVCYSGPANCHLCFLSYFYWLDTDLPRSIELLMMDCRAIHSFSFGVIAAGEN